MNLEAAFLLRLLKFTILMGLNKKNIRRGLQSRTRMLMTKIRVGSAKNNGKFASVFTSQNKKSVKYVNERNASPTVSFRNAQVQIYFVKRTIA